MDENGPRQKQECLKQQDPSNTSCPHNCPDPNASINIP